jgi:hemoglobin
MSEDILPNETAEEAIRTLVREFYVVARADDLLGPIFNSVVKDWDGHLATMSDFWSGALLGTDRYKAAPFPPHLKLDMGQEHFDRWAELWAPAARQHLPEPLGEKAASMGNGMSHCWGRAFVSMKQQMAEAEAG